MQLTTHPDTIRPDHSAGGFKPSTPFPLESHEVARKMATVIVRQAKDGQATELHHFRDAEETKDLTADEIAQHIVCASRIAARIVIRQDDPDYIPVIKDDTLPDKDPTMRPIAERMADEIIRGMSNARSEIHALQSCGHFTGGEIAKYIDDAKAIVERRLGRVAPPNPSLVALAFALKRMVTAVQNEVA